MTDLQGLLRGFVGTTGAMGRAGDQAKETRRAALIQGLERRSAELTRISYLWLGMMALAFAGVMAALIQQIANPYVIVPTGGVTVLALIKRVEHIWKEREQLGLVLQLALYEEDDRALHELMVRVRDAMLPAQHKAASSREAAAP